MKVWIICYRTESGDEGRWGYFLKRPTATQQKKFMKKNHPDENHGEHSTIYWHLEEFAAIKI